MAAFTPSGSSRGGPSMISPPPRSSSVQSIATTGKEDSLELQRQQLSLNSKAASNTTASPSHQVVAAATAAVPLSSSRTRPAIAPLELASGSRFSLGQRATSMSSLASKSDDSSGSRPASWRRPSHDPYNEAASPRRAAAAGSSSYDGASRASTSANTGALSHSSSSSLVQAASVDVATFIDLVLAFRAYPQPLLNNPAKAGETNYALTLGNAATRLSQHYLDSMGQQSARLSSPGRYSGAILLQYVEDLICPSGAPGSNHIQPTSLIDALRFMLVVEEARTAVLRGLPAHQPESATLLGANKQSTVLVAPKPRSRFFKAFSKDKSQDHVEFELCSPVSSSFDVAAPQQPVTNTQSADCPRGDATAPQKEPDFDMARRVSEATIKVDKGPQSEATDDEAIEEWSGRLQAALSGTSPTNSNRLTSSSHPEALNDPTASDSDDDDNFTDSSDQLEAGAGAAGDEEVGPSATRTQPNTQPVWTATGNDIPQLQPTHPPLPISLSLPTIPRRRMSTGLPVIPPSTTPPPVPPLDARWRVQPASTNRLSDETGSANGSYRDRPSASQGNLDGIDASATNSSPPVPPKDVVSMASVMTTTPSTGPRISPLLNSSSERRHSPGRRPDSAYLDNSTPPPIPRRMQSTVWTQPPDDVLGRTSTPTSLLDPAPSPLRTTMPLRPSHHLDRQHSTDSNASSELPPYHPALPGRMASLPVSDSTTDLMPPYEEYDGNDPAARSAHSSPSQAMPISRPSARPSIPTRSRRQYPGNREEADAADNDDDDDNDGEWVGTAEARRRSLLSFAQSQESSPSMPSSTGMRTSATAPSLYPTSWSRASPSPSPSRQPPAGSSRTDNRSPGLVVDWQQHS